MTLWGENAVTLIDQQDRCIVCENVSPPSAQRGISRLTGLKSKATYQPVLLEYNNENGGTGPSAPYGISKASVIYEYQTHINGTMGICALFQDFLPEKCGPIGYASAGGMMVQSDWNCGYVYHDLPRDSKGNLTMTGNSIQSWIDSRRIPSDLLFPAHVGRFKAWKKIHPRGCFHADST